MENYFLGISSCIESSFCLSKSFYSQRDRQNTERWNPAFERGDYGIVSIIEGGSTDIGADRRAEDLLNIEIFFKWLLENLRKAKSHASPVLMMDLGGMVGLTMARLAYHFRKQVEKGEYVFVITNLGFTPETASHVYGRNDTLLLAIDETVK